MKGKRVLFVLIVLFMIVYYIARIAIFGVTLLGDMGGLEHEQSELVEAMISYSFLGIGVLGFVFLPGVVIHRYWGFYGTVAVSLYTIAWDVWAAIWVQSSAAIGIAPAAIILGYLFVTRMEFLSPR